MTFAKVDLFRRDRLLIVASCLRFLLVLLTTVLACIDVPRASAGGPRFVTGPGMAAQSGQPETWSTTTLRFFTDPGPLSAAVSHAQADQMVAAAAAVWNVPTSSLSLVQGGQLAEHVSEANSYFYGGQLVLPADVQSSNEAAVPVAVIYDTDGSVTDLLLGAGASDPAECMQAGVTQSVDDIQTDGHIHHALVVINGRCVGSAPEQLTQMQYQLARAFGRVLGLAWSQLNDNVFTGARTLTANQVKFWPLMHPLDILCAAYSYQCMTDPFTLRPDDLSALALLYPIYANNVPSGKQASDTDAAYLYDIAAFPTGQGMSWLNLAATRQRYGATDDYQIVSSLSGVYYQQSLSSPVSGPAVVNQGSPFPVNEGLAPMRVVPLAGLANVTLASEPINQLYTGEYSIGPYVRIPTTPSGSSQGWTAYSLGPFPDSPLGQNSTAWDATSTCDTGADGNEGSPQPLDGSGWQQGRLCGWGHNSWWSAAVKAGHAWTLEGLATDETGVATTGKAELVLGIWNAGDAAGTSPTLASAPVPFNSLALGVTQIRMTGSSSDLSLRMMVGDLYGAGRPDFTYTARLLYADRLSPSSVGAGGGLITITGTGFRRGNVVEVNGVRASVTAWTSTTITAIVPSSASVAVAPGTAVTVVVRDLTTGAVTSIPDAFSYTTAPDQLELVSLPAKLETGVVTAVPFSVRVLASDGVTALPGATVRFEVVAGGATLGLCSVGTVCTGVSDTAGLVSTTVIGMVEGSVVLTATEVSGGAQLVENLTDVAPVRGVRMVSSDLYVVAGTTNTVRFQLETLQDGMPLAGVPVLWTPGPGVNLLSSDSGSGSDGLASAKAEVETIASGDVLMINGCAWTTLCAAANVHGVDPSQLQVTAISGTGQSVVQGMPFTGVQLLATDGFGHPVGGATVTVHQRVLSWEGPCTGPNRCPAASVLTSAVTTFTSGLDGTMDITPLVVDGVPQTVEIAVTYGETGFLTLTLVKAPA